MKHLPILIALLTVTVFGGETNTTGASSGATQRYIRVCTNPNWMPIEFVEDGVPKGISIDTLNILAETLNLHLEYIPTDSWVQSQQYLKEHRCDILPSAIRTEKRLKYARFTHPYLEYPLAIITHKDYPLVNSLDSIVDKPMARKKGSGLIHKLRKMYPQIKIIETPGYKEAFEMTENKTVYFTIATLPVLAYYKNKYGLKDLQIAGHTEMKYRLRIMVRDDRPDLVRLFDQALTRIPKGASEAIYDKWTTQTVIKTTDYRMVWTVLGVFGIITTIIMVAYFKQRKLHARIKVLNETLEKRVHEEVEKNKEQQILMLHQSRLAQMGETLSMIAHQWRQPLAAISANANSILLKAQRGKLDKETAHDLATKIIQYTRHLSATIDDFRDFFRPGRERKDTTFEEIVDATLQLVQEPLANKGITLIKQIECDKTFYTYPNEIKQVLLNLIKNAEDALLERKIPYPLITIETHACGLYVHDNAGGIDPEYLEKIFDPYFSTKSKKDGTGLGLYMSKIIIEDHCGGTLNIRNEREGAVAEIVLDEEKNTRSALDS
jgi:signal transduction histidine kinase